MATLSQNISQAIDDFHSIETAIQSKGVQVLPGTPTSQYANCIRNISTDDSELRGLIDGSLTSVNIPDGVSTIRRNAFYYSDMVSVSIPNSVTDIGREAFKSCGSLLSVVIPDSVTAIGAEAFEFCSNLITAKLPSTINTINAALFGFCPCLTNIDIPTTVFFIDNAAFRNSGGLTSVRLPDILQEMGNYVFTQCWGLTTINIPRNLSRIGYGVFDSCGALEVVTIENGFNCNSLDLSSSTKYSTETIVSWLEALADRTGLTAYTLTMGQINLDKLTSEQIAIAANKNWNLA
jgi:hypothetical protein